MKVAIKESRDIETILKADLTWNEVKKDYQKTLQNLRQGVRVDGFRPGKVPVHIVKRMFAGRIRLDFTNAVVRKTLQDVLKEAAIDEYVDISIKNVEYSEDETFWYVIKVETDPEITLPNYQKGFTVRKPVYIVDKEDVEMNLEDLREQHAEVREVPDGAQEGHYMLCDLQELDVSGVPLIGKKVEDRMIKIGEGIFGESGAANLIGARPGDEVNVFLKQQDGGESPYRVKVKRVESRDLPELTDEFVQQNIDTSDSVKSLRKNVEESLQAEWDKRADQELSRNISDYFIENVKFEIPPGRIERFLDNVIEDLTARNNNKELDVDRIRQEYRPVAEREIRWYLIEKAIRKRSDIKVSGDEIDQRIEELVQKYTEDMREQVRGFYQERKSRARIENDLMEQKVFDHLKSFAKIKKDKIKTSEFRKRNLK